MTNVRLPTECLLKIFENFSPEYHFWNEDYKLLYKCILVDREWCTTAISILWREPLDWIHFSVGISRNEDRLSSIISTYLSCLPQEIKSNLIQDGIDLPLNYSNPLFDYPKFLQSLDYGTLYKSINGWLRITRQLGELNKLNVTYKIFQVFNSLANLFMDRCHLKRLHFSKSAKVDFILPLTTLPKANICLANLTTFMCEGCTMPEIMFAAAKICKYISEFQILCCCKDNKGLATLIESQIVPLRYIFIKATKSGNFPFIGRALRKRAHSVRDLWIHGHCSMMDTFSTSDELQHLFIYPTTNTITVDRQSMEKFVNSKFTQLRELEISLKVITLKQLCTMIRNMGGNVESILIIWSEPPDVENLTLLAETVIQYGKNLNYYEAPFSHESIHYLPLIFKSCQKLEMLHILSKEEEEGFIYDISDIFSKLGEIVPLSLQKFVINHTWDVSAEALETFLINCSKRLKTKLDFNLDNTTSDHDLILYRYSLKGVCTFGTNDYYIC
ncbi:3293_t:CDS:1 [Funneliformis geosporum]|uniref:1569_t:CDS:1 n=1 Tax=Funneliformis geosporum TaxID=1117311 RepID=A0A9W4SH20_9GLOM|nr:3293_t:CDS:1 [Funneliformis geosporum]CAI2168646.1 1569_t:CDS:1 [Funneliformis geosporum]